MSRMKTLFEYALLVVVFFIFSTFASNVILNNSYHSLAAKAQISESEDGLKVETTDVRANKRQGSFAGKITNTSGNRIDKKYIKITAYDGDIPLQTRYLEVNNLEPGETREFLTKFTADEIDNYKVDYVDEVPIERTKVDDLIDDVKAQIKRSKILAAISGGNSFSFQPVDVNQFDIPDWVWLISIGIVLYYLPSGAIWFII